MQIKEHVITLMDTLGAVYERLFHKRNIIIVSERKVKHVPISGGFQLALITVIAGGVCWASYSTGSYYAARSALKEQTITLKSVVGSKVNSAFSLGSESVITPLASSKASFSSLDNTELFARITELEQKLKEVEDSKKSFIEKVQQKTAKNIDSFENMIEQTGLDLDKLKDQAAAKPDTSAKNEEGQGGPYIPADLFRMSTPESQVISQLDELAALKQIVDNLPVRKPIYDYQEMSQFGRRIDPFTGRLALHSGIDLAGAPQSKIYATANGKVSHAGRVGAYGNMVDIDHGFDVSTRYAHLSQILVENGQQVKKGQVIAIQGSTGRSTGAHLHYEVRYKDKPLDPRNFLTVGRYVQKS